MEKENLLALIKSEKFLALATTKAQAAFLVECQKKRALNRMSVEKLAWFFGYCAGVCGGTEGYEKSLKLLKNL